MTCQNGAKSGHIVPTHVPSIRVLKMRTPLPLLNEFFSERERETKKWFDNETNETFLRRRFLASTDDDNDARHHHKLSNNSFSKNNL